jgi:hypothetical protein
MYLSLLYAAREKSQQAILMDHPEIFFHTMLRGGGVIRTLYVDCSKIKTVSLFFFSLLLDLGQKSC